MLLALGAGIWYCYYRKPQAGRPPRQEGLELTRGDSIAMMSNPLRRSGAVVNQVYEQNMAVPEGSAGAGGNGDGYLRIAGVNSGGDAHVVVGGGGGGGGSLSAGVVYAVPMSSGDLGNGVDAGHGGDQVVYAASDASVYAEPANDTGRAAGAGGDTKLYGGVVYNAGDADGNGGFDSTNSQMYAIPMELDDGTANDGVLVAALNTTAPEYAAVVARNRTSLRGGCKGNAADRRGGGRDDGAAGDAVVDDDGAGGGGRARLYSVISADLYAQVLPAAVQLTPNSMYAPARAPGVLPTVPLTNNIMYAPARAAGVLATVPLTSNIMYAGAGAVASSGNNIYNVGVPPPKRANKQQQRGADGGGAGDRSAGGAGGATAAAAAANGIKLVQLYGDDAGSDDEDAHGEHGEVGSSIVYAEYAGSSSAPADDGMYEEADPVVVDATYSGYAAPANGGDARPTPQPRLHDSANSNNHYDVGVPRKRPQDESSSA